MFFLNLNINRLNLVGYTIYVFGLIPNHCIVKMLRSIWILTKLGICHSCNHGTGSGVDNNFPNDRLSSRSVRKNDPCWLVVFIRNYIGHIA